MFITKNQRVDNTKKVVVICFLLYTVFVSAFQESHTIDRKEIDSLLLKIDPRFNNNKNLHVILKKSKEINYQMAYLKAHAFLSIYHRKKIQYDSAFYYVERAIRIAKAHGFKEELHLSYSAKGNIYLETEEYYKALLEYKKTYNFYATKIEDTSTVKLKNETNSYSRFRNSKLNIAKAYSNLGEYELAEKFNRDIINSPNISKKSLSYTNTFNSMGLNYHRQERYDEAIKCYKDGLDLAIEYKHDRLRHILTFSLCKSLCANKQFIEAKKYFSTLDQSFGIKDYSHVLGLINNGIGNTDLAEENFLSSIKKKGPRKDYLTSYTELLKLYEKQGFFKKLISLNKAYINIKDSLNQKRNNEIIKNSEIGFKLIEEELKTKQLETENKLLTSKAYQQKILIIGIIGVLLLMLCLFYFYIQKQKAKKEIKILKINEKRILENQILERENELTSTLMVFNNKIEELKKINEYINENPSKNAENAIVVVKKHLEGFINTNSDIKLITERIESQFPGITSQLKTIHPELTSNDIKHCLLVKLKLSTKECARIMNVSVSAVKMARQRIKKKMDFEDHQSLSKYLDKITEEIFVS